MVSYPAFIFNVDSPYMQVNLALAFCSGALTLYRQSDKEGSLRKIIWHMNKTTSFFFLLIRTKWPSGGRSLGKEQEKYSLSHRILLKK